jgi:hypothetical protein
LPTIGSNAAAVGIGRVTSTRQPNKASTLKRSSVLAGASTAPVIAPLALTAPMSSSP